MTKKKVDGPKFKVRLQQSAFLTVWYSDLPFCQFNTEDPPLFTVILTIRTAHFQLDKVLEFCYF